MGTNARIQFSLIELPTETLEEVLFHLHLADRKNLRLTCKRLYEICNKKQFCRSELISWTNETDSHVILAFCESSRSYYNLVIDNVGPIDDSILSFFKLHGSKVHSLSIRRCKFSPGFLEALIMYSEAVCDLSLIFVYGFCSFEMKSILRKVISLQLVVPSKEDLSIFFYHRIFSVFPNLTYLDLEMEDLTRRELVYPDSKIAETFSGVFDEIMKLSCLEILKMSFPMKALFKKSSQFFEALPNLKNLHLNWNNVTHGLVNSMEWYSHLSRLSSIELHNLKDHSLADILIVLSGSKLENLALSSNKLIITSKIYEALMSSRLKIINFSASQIVIRNFKIDLPAMVNETVTDLSLLHDLPRYQEFNIRVLSPISFFCPYFCSLVNLKLHIVKDEDLQSIFKYLKNLRSLYLGNCFICSEAGFSGAGNDRSLPIKKLQKLEHLTIKFIKKSVILSKDFKTAFKFSRLKYLLIQSCYDDDKCPEVPFELLKPLINLEAVRLGNFLTPSSERLLLLNKNLKRLKFLRVDKCRYSIGVVLIDLKHFAINISNYEHSKLPGSGDALEQIVLPDLKSPGKILCKPQISSFTIDWIEI